MWIHHEFPKTYVRTGRGEKEEEIRQSKPENSAKRVTSELALQGRRLDLGKTQVDALGGSRDVRSGSGVNKFVVIFIRVLLFPFISTLTKRK